MILVDAGPLISLIDKGDPIKHQQCKLTFRTFKEPLLTTWPCLTEAIYFLGELQGWRGQDALWAYVERGALRISTPGSDDWKRVRTLMDQYNDTPMDLADASLVVLAEVTGIARIFTLDSDFRIYRIHGRESFDVIELVSP